MKMKILYKKYIFLGLFLSDIATAIPLTKAETEMVFILKGQLQSAVNFLKREKSFKSEAYKRGTLNALRSLEQFGIKDPSSDLQSAADNFRVQIEALSSLKTEPVKPIQPRAGGAQEQDRPTSPEKPQQGGQQQQQGNQQQQEGISNKGYKEEFKELMKNLAVYNKALQKNELTRLFEDPAITILKKWVGSVDQPQWGEIGKEVKVAYGKALSAHMAIVQNKLKASWGFDTDISKEFTRFSERVDAVLRNKVYKEQVQAGEQVYSLKDFENFVDEKTGMNFSAADRDKTEKEALTLAANILAIAVKLLPEDFKMTIRKMKDLYFDLAIKNEGSLVWLYSSAREIAETRSAQFNQRLDQLAADILQKHTGKAHVEEPSGEDVDDLRESFDVAVAKMTGKSSKDKDAYEKDALEAAQELLKATPSADRKDIIEYIKDAYEKAVISQYSFPSVFGNPVKIEERKKSFDDQLDEWLVENGLVVES